MLLGVATGALASKTLSSMLASDIRSCNALARPSEAARQCCMLAHVAWAPMLRFAFGRRGHGRRNRLRHSKQWGAGLACGRSLLGRPCLRAIVGWRPSLLSGALAAKGARWAVARARGLAGEAEGLSQRAPGACAAILGAPGAVCALAVALVGGANFL